MEFNGQSSKGWLHTGEGIRDRSNECDPVMVTVSTDRSTWADGSKKEVYELKKHGAMNCAVAEIRFTKEDREFQTLAVTMQGAKTIVDNLLDACIRDEEFRAAMWRRLLDTIPDGDLLNLIANDLRERFGKPT